MKKLSLISLGIVVCVSFGSIRAMDTGQQTIELRQRFQPNEISKISSICKKLLDCEEGIRRSGIEDGCCSKYIELCVEGMKYERSFVRQTALGICCDLARKGYTYKKAVSIIKKAMKDDPDKFVRLHALTLFKDLMKEKEQGYQEFMKDAGQTILDSYSAVKFNTLIGCSEVVRKGYGYEEALVVANKGINDEDRGVKSRALELYAELVKKGQGYKEALAAASKGVRDGSVGAFELFVELLRQGHGYKEAIEAASDRCGKSAGEDMSLYFLIITHAKERIDITLEAAKSFIKALDSPERVKKVLLSIITKGHPGDGSVRMASFLYEELVKKGQEYEKEANYEKATNGALDSDRIVAHAKEGIDQALAIAKSHIKLMQGETDFLDALVSIDTIDALDSPEKVKELLTFIIKRLDSKDRGTQLICASLLINLITQKVGFDGSPLSLPCNILKEITFTNSSGTTINGFQKVFALAQKLEQESWLIKNGDRMYLHSRMQYSVGCALTKLLK